MRNAYRLVLPAATPYADLFNENATRVVAPVAPYLLRGDTLEVLDEAGTYFALLLVTECVQARHASFVELFKKPLQGEPIDDMAGNGKHRAAWGGWVRRYCVVRPNGGIAREGLRTREEADQDAHQRNVPSFHKGTLG